MSRYSELLIGGLVVLAGIGLLAASTGVQDFSTGTVDASFMPRIAAVLFILLGGILAVQGWKQPQPEAARTSLQGRLKPDIQGGWAPVLLSFVLMVAYVGLLDSLGFVLASAAYVFAQIQLLRKQAQARRLLFLLVAVLVPTGAYLLFVHVFEVMVPASVLG